MSDLELPAGTYLGWRYVDRRRDIDRAQLYHDDGTVEAIEGEAHWELCRLTAEQVAAAKAALAESGLLTARDSPAGAASDAAPVTYAWRLGNRAGRVTNMSYPAAGDAAIERLDRALAEIEEAAGCWPLLAHEDET